MSRENALGIMGGSFDPIHLGHVQVAQAVREALQLSGILFLPSGRPPHKAHLGAPAVDRLEMTRLATEEYPWAQCCDIEVFREGTIYTVDTLGLLRQQYENTALYYIIGADTLLDLKNWKNTEKVASMCSFVCVQRPGIARAVMETERVCLQERFAARILFVEAVGPAISSTEIRERLRAGRSTEGLLHENVRRYIEEKKLYL